MLDENAGFIIVKLCEWRNRGASKKYRTICEDPNAQCKSCDGERELGILRFQDNFELKGHFHFLIIEFWEINYFFDVPTPSLKNW